MALGVVLWPIKLKNCTFLVEVHLLSFSLPMFGEMSSLDRHILESVISNCNNYSKTSMEEKNPAQLCLLNRGSPPGHFY